MTDNWILACDENEIELEDLKRFDYQDKTFCIYKLDDGIQYKSIR